MFCRPRCTAAVHRSAFAIFALLAASELEAEFADAKLGSTAGREAEGEAGSKRRLVLGRRISSQAAFTAPCFPTWPFSSLSVELGEAARELGENKGLRSRGRAVTVAKTASHTA